MIFFFKVCIAETYIILVQVCSYAYIYIYIYIIVRLAQDIMGSKTTTSIETCSYILNINKIFI